MACLDWPPFWSGTEASPTVVHVHFDDPSGWPSADITSRTRVDSQQLCLAMDQAGLRRSQISLAATIDYCSGRWVTADDAEWLRTVVPDIDLWVNMTTAPTDWLFSL